MSAKIKIYNQGGVITYELSFDNGVTYNDPISCPPQHIAYDQIEDDILIIRTDLDKDNSYRVFLGDYTNVLDESGASTGATASDVYEYLTSISEGASGGSVQNGFIDYNDATGTISLTADTWTDIPNDGAGAFSNSLYKPTGVTELMDTTTGYIDVSELDLGDTVLIRNDYQVNPNTNNSLLEFRYELGTGLGTYTLEKIVGRLDSGSGQNYRFSLEPDLIYMGDTNTRDNAIKLQVKLSTDGTLTNAGSVIQVIKR